MYATILTTLRTDYAYFHVAVVYVVNILIFLLLP